MEEDKELGGTLEMYSYVEEACLDLNKQNKKLRVSYVKNYIKETYPHLSNRNYENKPHLFFPDETVGYMIETYKRKRSEI